MEEELIQFCQDKRVDAAFDRAFDRVDHEFLYKVKEAFGIGENFINWIKNLYANATTRIFIKTEKIPVKRGVRQGDPISSSLYVRRNKKNH